MEKGCKEKVPIVCLLYKLFFLQVADKLCHYLWMYICICRGNLYVSIRKSYWLLSTQLHYHWFYNKLAYTVYYDNETNPAVINTQRFLFLSKIQYAVESIPSVMNILFKHSRHWTKVKPNYFQHTIYIKNQVGIHRVSRWLWGGTNTYCYVTFTAQAVFSTISSFCSLRN